MNIYDYVAMADPIGSKLLINSMGYSLPDNVDDPGELSQNLNDLVASEGDKALAAIVDIHPDKELILEKTSQQKMVKAETARTGGCGCGGKCKGESSVSQGYVADAQANQGASLMPLHQGNIMLIGAAFLLAVAIIVSNKK